MENLSRSLRIFTGLILVSSCSAVRPISGPEHVGLDGLAVRPDQFGSAKETSGDGATKPPRERVSISCVVRYHADPTENAKGCSGIAFRLQSSTGEELDRRFPDAGGLLDFRVSSGLKYRIVPDASEAWTVEAEPSGLVEAGAKVRFVLSR